MSKRIEKRFTDVNIAFANELSVLCDKVNIDVRELIKLANLHPRVEILSPGAGVGGHCIAVDPWFIVSSDPKNSKLIKTAREVNDTKPNWVVDKIEKCIKNNDEVETAIAIYGLSFKPNIDDLRQSPALQIAEMSESLDATSIFIVEPNIDQLPKSLKRSILVDYDFAISNADIHIFLVTHDEFLNKEKPKNRILDICGIW